MLLSLPSPTLVLLGGLESVSADCLVLRVQCGSWRTAGRAAMAVVPPLSSQGAPSPWAPCRVPAVQGQAGVPHQVRHCGHGYGCPTGPAKLQQHRRGLHCVPVLVLDAPGARPQLLPWLGAPHPSVHPARPQGERGPSRSRRWDRGLGSAVRSLSHLWWPQKHFSALPGLPNLPTISPWGSAPLHPS